MGEYPLNCYAGVNLRYDNDEMLHLAEQENWEEVMEALEIKLAPVNKSRNIENKKKKGEEEEEEETFNCQSLKYLGELTIPHVLHSEVPLLILMPHCQTYI